MAHYVHDENHNRIAAYSAEEVLSVLAQAIEDGDLDHITADAAFITRLKSIADGKTYFVAFLTQAEYNALVQADELEENTLYYITDDTTISDFQDAIAALQASTSASILSLQQDVGGLQRYINGLGVPVAVTEDQGIHKAEVTETGLYACIVANENNTVNYSLMMSVYDLSQGFTFVRMPVTVLSPNDTVIEVGARGNTSNAVIYCTTSGFHLAACHLIVPYRSAQ